MRARKLITAFAAVPLLLSGAIGAAMADDISNDLDASIDAVAEVMPLTAGGPAGSTELYVSPANGDGKNGCNLTGDSTLRLSVASSDTAVATVSPSQVTFTSCGDTKTLTVVPVAKGSATVSVAQSANTTGGTFALAPASFTVDVGAAAPANTPPTVEVTGVTAGGSYAKGTVPAATCEVTDAEDGNSSFPATLSAVTGDYAVDGIGSQSATCSYTDGSGVQALESKTYSIIDPSGPEIGYTLNPATPDGDNGWYQGNVSLTWSVDEPESPSSLDLVGCVDTNITADQKETEYGCSASSAGGSAGPTSVTIKRDGTAPTVASKVTAGTLGSNGWFTSDVDVEFTASDALSGIQGDAAQTVTSSGEGRAIRVASPVFTDIAGNSTEAGAVTETFDIDKTGPTQVTFSGGPAADQSYYRNTVPAAPTCSAEDGLSGIESCVVEGYSTELGSHTLTAVATDKAGNVSRVTGPTYRVTLKALGFFAPVDRGIHNTVKGGATVPLKFEVFDGADEITLTSVVKSFSVKSATCPGAVSQDAVEETSTLSTGLKFDAVSGHFIQSWKTPKAVGCYTATITLTDGSPITADFLLK